MKLTFEKMVIVNFGSFRGKHLIPLDVGAGIHFVDGINQTSKRLGSNGAGKSTLWAALCWCLYGRTIRKLRNNDIRSWDVTKRTRVTVYVSGHEITRTASPNSLSLDGKHVGQERIDKLIGLGFETFGHTILRGQGCPLFFDLDAKGKMDLFVDVLDLNRWDARSERADARRKKLVGERERISGLLLGYELQMADLRKRLKRAEADAQAWEDERQRHIESRDKVIVQIGKTVERLQREYNEFDLAADSAGTQLKLIEKSVTDAQAWFNVMRDKMFDQRVLVQDAHSKADEYRRRLKRIGKGDTCPTCGQSLTGAKLRKHAEDLKLRIGKCEQVVIDNEVQRNYDAAEAGFKQLEREQERFQKAFNDARDHMATSLPMLENAKAQLKHMEKDQQGHREQDNPHNVMVTSLRKQRRRLQADIEDEQQMLALYDRRIGRIKFWVKGFKDVRLYLVEEILEQLEFVSTAMLEQFGLRGWAVKFAIERETKAGTQRQGIDVRIQSPNSDTPRKWDTWSGGEGQRLRLISSFALSDILLQHANVDTNLEILDEPSRGLSDAGVDDLMTLLRERAHDTRRSIFYVDHRVYKGGDFASTVHVIKDKQGSYVSV